VGAGDGAEEEDLPTETEADKAHPDNKALVVEPDFGGPCQKRKCTDCLCVLLLIACWFTMTFIGLACIPGSGVESARLNKGNPYRLINGLDYKAQICGISDAVKAKSKLYYLPTGDGVCVKKCPKSTSVDRFVCTYNVQNDLDAVWASDGEAAYVVEGLKQVKREKCSVEYATEDVINYCLSTDAIDLGEELADSAVEEGMDKYLNTTSYADSKKEWHEKMYGDIFLSYPYIFGFGIGGAIVVGFVYTFFLRIPGVLALIVWGLLFTIFFFLMLGAYMCSVTAKRWSDDEERDKTQADGMKYMSYTLFGFAAVWLCLLCCLRKRIMLAIGIVKEAAKSIATMPIIVLFPVLQILGLVIFVVPWFIYCLYLASSGEIKTIETAAGNAKQFEYDDNTYYAGWYMVFIYYWTSEFIVAVGQIIIAMAVSTWYFTRDKSKIGNGTVIKSIKTSFFYHAGTAAFGSLVIAIIKTIRAIVAYIQKKANKTKRCRVLIQAVLCCIQCCLWCVEKCMKFLNKNAYIQTAIFGHSFCKAARCAFFLILRNIARIATLGLVSGFVLLLGKIIITAGATLMCYLALDATIADDQLNYLWLPLIFTAIVAFYVAQMFNEVWGMAMSTILQCFVADEEIYKSDKDAMFAGKDLKSTVSNSNRGKYKDKGKVAPGPGDAGDKVV